MSSPDAPLHQTAWLFTRQYESVRLEIRPTAEGFVLLVQGPGSLGETHEFQDAATVEIFRNSYERDLVARGFRLQAVAERRGGQDRQRTPRPDDSDRRR